MCLFIYRRGRIKSDLHSSIRLPLLFIVYTLELVKSKSMASTSPQTAFMVAVIDLQDQLNHHRMDTLTWPPNAGGFVVDWNSG